MRRLALALALLAIAPSAHAQAVRVDRLERLADFLERQVPPDRYDQQHFSNGVPPDSEAFRGCAGGWAGKLFAGEGLRPNAYGYPQYRGQNGYDAMAAFFGLPIDRSISLFGAGPRTRDDEVRLIRSVVAGERARLAATRAGGGIAVLAAR